jgi:hypothetical protein
MAELRVSINITPESKERIARAKQSIEALAAVCASLGSTLIRATNAFEVFDKALKELDIDFTTNDDTYKDKAIQ